MDQTVREILDRHDSERLYKPTPERADRTWRKEAVQYGALTASDNHDVMGAICRGICNFCDETNPIDCAACKGISTPYSKRGARPGFWLKPAKESLPCQ